MTAPNLTQGANELKQRNEQLNLALVLDASE